MHTVYGRSNVSNKYYPRLPLDDERKILGVTDLLDMALSPQGLSPTPPPTALAGCFENRSDPLHKRPRSRMRGITNNWQIN